MFLHIMYVQKILMYKHVVMYISYPRNWVLRKCVLFDSLIMHAYLICRGVGARGQEV